MNSSRRPSQYREMQYMPLGIKKVESSQNCKVQLFHVPQILGNVSYSAPKSNFSNQSKSFELEESAESLDLKLEMI
jgi:hypothetical protein